MQPPIERVHILIREQETKAQIWEELELRILTVNYMHNQEDWVQFIQDLDQLELGKVRKMLVVH